MKLKKEYSLILAFLLAFCFGAVAETNTMEAWAEQKFGLTVPKLEEGWKTLSGSNEYEWYVRWKDAKFQIRDKDENFYRVYWQNGMLYLDYKRDFVLRKWEF